MNRFLSRVITGIIGLVIGGILGILVSYPLAYIINATTISSGGMMSGPNMTYAVLFVLGGAFGIISGLIIGILQPPTLPKGILYGGFSGIVIVFIIVILINPGINNRDNLSTSDILGAISIICTPIVCGAIIGLIVSLINKTVLGYFRDKHSI
jgi:hypothetical protein